MKHHGSLSTIFTRTTSTAIFNHLQSFFNHHWPFSTIFNRPTLSPCNELTHPRYHKPPMLNSPPKHLRRHCSRSRLLNRSTSEKNLCLGIARVTDGDLVDGHCYFLDQPAIILYKIWLSRVVIFFLQKNEEQWINPQQPPFTGSHQKNLSYNMLQLLIISMRNGIVCILCL